MHDDPSSQLIRFALVNSIECITGRHLLETTVGAVAEALGSENVARRCESMSQLTVKLSKMLKDVTRHDGFRFVLVFDAVDRQREMPPTLLPALARLPEIVRALEIPQLLRLSCLL